jgi:hypothetical protein
VKRKNEQENQPQQTDFDKELSNPLHDEILLWVHNNAADIINRLFYEDWAKKDLSFLCGMKQSDLKMAIEKFGKDSEQAKIAHDICYIHLKQVPHKPPLKVKTKYWSYPVMAPDKQLYFIDMKIEFEDYTSLHGVEMKQSDKKLLSKYEFIIDRDDVQWHCRPVENSLNIEAIADFKSLSSVLRKIKLCKGHESGGQYCIVSPDDKFEAVLKDQKIFFVRYPIKQNPN